MKTDISRLEQLGHLIVSIFITGPAVIVGRAMRIAHRSLEPGTVDKTIKTILVVLVQQLGDIIVSSGYLKSVRQTFPTAKITLVVDHKFIKYASKCPHADEVFGFDESASKYLRVLLGPVSSFVFVRKQLRDRSFDLVINSRWDTDTRHAAFIGLFSNSTRHVGYASGCNPRKRIINPGLNGAFTDLNHTQSIVHESERGPDLLRFLGFSVPSNKSEMWLSESDFEYAENNLGDTRRIIALGIGASESKRRWPLIRYLELAKKLLAVYPELRFLIVGDKEDRRRAEESLTVLRDRLLNFAGICQVTQSAAMLSRCYPLHW